MYAIKHLYNYIVCLLSVISVRDILIRVILSLQVLYSFSSSFNFVAPLSTHCCFLCQSPFDMWPSSSMYYFVFVFILIYCSNIEKPCNGLKLLNHHHHILRIQNMVHADLHTLNIFLTLNQHEHVESVNVNVIKIYLVMMMMMI